MTNEPSNDNSRKLVNEVDNPEPTPNDQTELIIVGQCEAELWSLSATERHRRAFERVGVCETVDGEATGVNSIVAVRADYLLGPDIVSALSKQTNIVLTDADGRVAIAIHMAGELREFGVQLLERDEFDPFDGALGNFDIVSPEELGSFYDNVLRKRSTPFALSYETTSIDMLEQKTFGAAYKGATDFVTKWCWPRPARTVTRWAAAHGISPNTITTVSLVLVLLATWMFYEGFLLLAIPIAWAMTFLDTVDGKLARVTVTSSWWGNIYDHGIDLIHPPFWWWAWYVGVLPSSAPKIASLLEPALWIILGGYLVGRLLEGIFVLLFKIETHIWQPIDFFFRTITARRNPNLAILTLATLLQRPDIGFVAVAGWTIISLVFHAVRLVQAALQRSRGTTISSWLTADN
jgi:phosphatidylglycerophosphate synthase